MVIVYDKGFEPTLFESIDKALVTTLGKVTVSTFYYHMTETHKIKEAQLPQRASHVLQYLKDILGEAGFQTIEKPVILSIKARFEIKENVQDLTQVIDLAKRNYLRESL